MTQDQSEVDPESLKILEHFENNERKVSREDPGLKDPPSSGPNET